jgi:hypothetical protein
MPGGWRIVYDDDGNVKIVFFLGQFRRSAGPAVGRISCVCFATHLLLLLLLLPNKVHTH